MTKPADASFGSAYALDRKPMYCFHLLNDHLGDTVAMGNGMLFGGEVDEDDFELAAVVGIDGTRGVQAGYSMFKCQPAAGPYLRFIALRKLNEQAGRYGHALQGLKGYRAG